MSFGGYLGAVRDRCRPASRSASWTRCRSCSTPSTATAAQGYLRIKLKIEPGWDVEPVRAVRERFGDDLLLQVDANTAYTLADARHLARLDPFDLLLIEQPLPEDDLRGHAALARLVRTPICLDESITSARAAADAIALGATSVVNVKPGRVGGYLEARRVHDVCAANGVPVWCGGMLETGIGRAANVALAALPDFTLPRRHVGVGPLLRPRHHRAVRAATTGTWPCRPARASASRPTPTAWPRSPPRPSGSRSSDRSDGSETPPTRTGEGRRGVRGALSPRRRRPRRGASRWRPSRHPGRRRRAR